MPESLPPPPATRACLCPGFLSHYRLLQSPEPPSLQPSVLVTAASLCRAVTLFPVPCHTSSHALVQFESVHCPALPRCPYLTSDMVRTRGRSRLRPRVRFSTPEHEEQAPIPAVVPEPVPEAVPEEPQGFRRYQTRMGPQAPSPVPQRRSRRARPSKRARTSGPGESSSSRPQPSQSPSAAEATSSPQLSPASRIRRPVGHPIPGNVGLHSRDFHGESYYDFPALTADPRFRDSMRLIEHYSLLPFMTSRQFYYPRVVLQFYHSMTSRGAPSPLELRFSIDDRPGVLRAADI